MTPMHVTCAACRGTGTMPPNQRSPWPLCAACDGCGFVFEPGAPGYGCELELGDRVPGEVVTLGNGDRGRVLRHCRNGTPTTWLGPIGAFSGIESHRPVTYPSSAGVAEIHETRVRVDRRQRENKRAVDLGDPLQRDFHYNRGI